ncbi:GlxA family transcriptional regulator [Goodfellowiella coeruleoviolacea]|uniref:Transcriptional regulator GlxA family, contains an amidase domain and an AraC-type DNA-binding HTH domain n=1 Tax=Goodfellowiella coeruleoviolacea TaxID=334858 RepID=A0AAE3GA39_9PSEU|nr:helix-turn-helix domain-containing protein [Goodfellowiella coeruleoviolacea]MCP2164305.1 Transcriptional regulator GlxA family, contains an amidase domain and an AraC-type DNA-binding HTH domain [Goodfellowiella coeruleoviolacea]
MHTVAVLALDGVIAFDLSTPIEVFSRTRLPDGRPAYRVRICAASPQVDAGVFTLQAPWGLDALSEADTIIVPGCANPTAPLPEDVLNALRAAAANGTRIASICSGAFILAATGLLDGLRATTHWIAAALLARRHPEVVVDPDVLYVDNGQFLTSAGAAAGLDLCLHMIRCDYGSAVAADAARLSVMPLEREGGQAQFIVHELPPTPQGSLLEPVLRWLTDNIGKDLTLEDIANHAGMSTRTLNRRFREQMGTTPLQWLHRTRIRQAQYLLESTDHGIDRIASQTGFGSATAFRDRFKRIVGISPHAYRHAFRGADTVHALASR